MSTRKTKSTFRKSYRGLKSDYKKFERLHSSIASDRVVKAIVQQLINAGLLKPEYWLPRGMNDINSEMLIDGQS